MLERNPRLPPARSCAGRGCSGSSLAGRATQSVSGRRGVRRPKLLPVTSRTPAPGAALRWPRSWRSGRWSPAVWCSAEPTSRSMTVSLPDLRPGDRFSRYNRACRNLSRSRQATPAVGRILAPVQRELVAIHRALSRLSRSQRCHSHFRPNQPPIFDDERPLVALAALPDPLQLGQVSHACVV